jgi:hypothetical protein
VGSEDSDDDSNKEPETEDSDAILTPVKEHPAIAIAKVQRGRKQKPFSPSGVLTHPVFYYRLFYNLMYSLLLLYVF